MQITSVGGKTVRNWEEVTYALVGHIGDPEIALTLRPMSQNSEVNDSTPLNLGKTYTLDTKNWQFDPDKRVANYLIRFGHL